MPRATRSYDSTSATLDTTGQVACINNCLSYWVWLLEAEAFIYLSL